MYIIQFLCLVINYKMLRGRMVYTLHTYIHSPILICRSDNKDYALKLIEGTGYSQSFSLSACREVAV